MLVIGQGAVVGPDGGKILRMAHQIAVNCELVKKNIGWNGFNVLHPAAARVGGLDLGFVPGKKGLNLEGILHAAEIGKIDALPQCVEETLPKDFVFSDLKGSKICVGKNDVK